MNSPNHSSSRQHIAAVEEYNYVTPTIRSPSGITVNPPEVRISRDNSTRYIPISGQNLPKADDSFEKMKYLPSPSQNIYPNRTFNESFVAVAQDLSFDVKHDHHF